MHGDLDRAARGGAEPEEPEPATGLDAADPEGAIADDASAQERRRGDVGDGIREPCREARTHRRVLGEAAVPIPAREASPQNTGSRGPHDSDGRCRRHPRATSPPPGRRGSSPRHPHPPPRRGRRSGGRARSAACVPRDRLRRAADRCDRRHTPRPAAGALPRRAQEPGRHARRAGLPPPGTADRGRGRA